LEKSKFRSYYTIEGGGHPREKIFAKFFSGNDSRDKTIWEYEFDIIEAKKRFPD
jgi:hypothetical protein